MELDPKASAGKTTGSSAPPRSVFVVLFSLSLLGSVLAGCLDPQDLDPVRGDASAPFVSVQLALQTFGQPPANVTALEFSFSGFSLYEKTSRQWVHLDENHDVRLDLAEERALLGTITLPAGSYQELSGGLDGATVHVDGDPVSALVSGARCHTPLDMKITPGMAQPRLTLFVWLDDALFQEDGVWQVRPAFSGSFAQANEAAFNQVDGQPRLSDPRCSPGGATDD